MDDRKGRTLAKFYNDLSRARWFARDAGRKVVRVWVGPGVFSEGGEAGVRRLDRPEVMGTPVELMGDEENRGLILYEESK